MMTICSRFKVDANDHPPIVKRGFLFWREGCADMIGSRQLQTAFFSSLSSLGLRSGTKRRYWHVSQMKLGDRASSSGAAECSTKGLRINAWPELIQ